MPLISSSLEFVNKIVEKMDDILILWESFHDLYLLI